LFAPNVGLRDYTSIADSVQHPYPCIGAYRFLDLSIISSPQYDEILSRVKNGEKFLDLGCCFGQEIRQLVSADSTAEAALPLRGSLTVHARPTTARRPRTSMART